MKNVLLFLLFQKYKLLVNLMPDRVRYYLGKGFGSFAYLVTKSRRIVAEDNLKMALGSNLSQEQIENTIKTVYQNMGLMLVEFILLSKLTGKNISDYIEVEGEDYLKDAFDRGKGVIIYGAHFGNWEWLAAAISLLGYPISAIAQEQNNSYFDRAVNKVREDKGIKILAKGMAVRKAYSRLKKGECLFILGDQDARKFGWKINFFDRPASTYPGAVQLAQRTGAAVVPAFLIREGWASHRLVFHSPQYAEKDLTEDEQKELLQELTDLTESVIRKHPAQWLWLHKRWKTY